MSPVDYATEFDPSDGMQAGFIYANVDRPRWHVCHTFEGSDGEIMIRLIDFDHESGDFTDAAANYDGDPFIPFCLPGMRGMFEGLKGKPDRRVDVYYPDGSMIHFEWNPSNAEKMAGRVRRAVETAISAEAEE